MGLDMYLSAKKYLSPYGNKEDETKIKDINQMFGFDTLYESDNDLRSISVNEIQVEVAYWRKANAIHNWFVEHCQGGIDECQETFVSREFLQDLLDLCKEVAKNPKKNAKLLPPQAGFFFGSTDIDEWYIEQNNFTVERLELILNSEKLKGFDFYYQSSW